MIYAWHDSIIGIFINVIVFLYKVYFSSLSKIISIAKAKLWKDSQKKDKPQSKFQSHIESEVKWCIPQTIFEDIALH